MLLPRIDNPISPGQVSLGGYEMLNTQSITSQVARALRQTHGFSEYLLTIPGTEEKARFLAEFGRLDDRQDEAKLSAALDDLLKTIIEACDEAVSAYDDRDQRILAAIAARSLKRVLADALKGLVEMADAQLAELRKEAHAA